MQRQIRIKSYLFLVVLMGLAAFVVGCGEDAMTTPEESATPEFARVIEEPGAAGGDAGLGRDCLAERMSDIGYKVIYPRMGGELTVGRFTVTIPAGALPAPALLRIQDLTVEEGMLITEIGPHGLQFLTPVILTMDLEGTSLEDAEDATIYWYDPEEEAWVDMGGTYDPQTKTVSAKLDHFSRYGGGRAGW
ncbi:MAG: hypothetical protein GF355_06860 [Candidatus Eisenbacteria bacterium]|nr:hypothetical protein [Candidatus Eisenbacteria bacterium]